MRIAAVVEGHGEVESVRTLLARTWREIVQGSFLEVLKPIRQPKSKLKQEHGLARAVRLAAIKLDEAPGEKMPGLILVLVDADSDCPGELGPGLTEWAHAAGTRQDISCVVIKIEFETWFAATAESLTKYLDLLEGDPPEDPEGAKAGKGWIKNRFRRGEYSETADQPRMTALMDLQTCRARSPSFDKLCRELEGKADTSIS